MGEVGCSPPHFSKAKIKYHVIRIGPNIYDVIFVCKLRMWK